MPPGFETDGVGSDNKVSAPAEINGAVIKALVCAALYPQIAIVDDSSKGQKKPSPPFRLPARHAIMPYVQICALTCAHTHLRARACVCASIHLRVCVYFESDMKGAAREAARAD